MAGRATADAVRLPENEFWYVYILKLSNGKIYTGCTSDITDRIQRHQNGYVNSTKSFLPVNLLYHGVFKDKYKAFEFEKYLKTGSGRAFIKRHFM